jgi:hypothetical protein
MNFLQIAARVAARPTSDFESELQRFRYVGSTKVAVYHPYPGDNVEITPISENEFNVRGKLGERSGGPMWLEGVITTDVYGGFDYEPRNRGIRINDDAYNALAEIMRVINPDI